jgi:carboxymethylenebutenolidase
LLRKHKREEPHEKAEIHEINKDVDVVRTAHGIRALKEAFYGAKVPVEVEVYPGALHGWCVSDIPTPTARPIYNKTDAERAWSKLLSLIKAILA